MPSAMLHAVPHKKASTPTWIAKVHIAHEDARRCPYEAWIVAYYGWCAVPDIDAYRGRIIDRLRRAYRVDCYDENNLLNKHKPCLLSHNEPCGTSPPIYKRRAGLLSRN